MRALFSTTDGTALTADIELLRRNCATISDLLEECSIGTGEPIPVPISLHVLQDLVSFLDTHGRGCVPSKWQDVSPDAVAYFTHWPSPQKLIEFLWAANYLDARLAYFAAGQALATQYLCSGSSRDVAKLFGVPWDKEAAKQLKEPERPDWAECVIADAFLDPLEEGTQGGDALHK